MTIEITSTRRDLHHVKFTVYGAAGVGKTVLCGTAPNPIILSAEAGLLSLAQKDIPVIEITSLNSLKEAYAYLKENNEYSTICLDSISDIAEQVLDTKFIDLERKAEMEGKGVDRRQGYGSMALEMMQLTRAFRSLNAHVVFTAKQGFVKDALTNITSFGPMLPGQMYTQNFPYYMDILCCLRVDKDGDRFLQTQPTIQYLAKDRSGKLKEEEIPDLTYIFNRVTSN